MTNAKQDFSNKPTARLAYLNEQRDEKAERQISPLSSCRSTGYYNAL